MPNASFPPPPPPHCKVLGRCAAALALTLAAVGGANLAQAQAQTIDDPPCVAATHFEVPGNPNKCVPRTGDIPADRELTAEADEFCKLVRGKINGEAGGFSGFCASIPGLRSCAYNGDCQATFNGIRDCNLANKKTASVNNLGAITCGDSCGAQQASGNECFNLSEVICEGGTENVNGVCACPDAMPNVGTDGNCTDECGAGEELNQAAKRCEACGIGEFKAEAGNGQCDSCFPPLTESDPPGSGFSSFAGLQIGNNGTTCSPLNECSAQNLAAKTLELCGPNAACNDLDPRDNPSGFVVGEWKYSCDCVEGFSDPNDGGQAKLNCSGTGARTVAILDSPGGAVSSTPPAGDLDFETQVVFTATPDLGFMVSAWVGADEWVRSGNCDAGATRCEVTVTRALEVGAVFEDVDECAAGSDGCPADSSCRNLDAAEGGGRFACDCDDASLDFAGGVCTGAREVAILASAGGAVSAVVSGDGTVIETKGDVAHGATVVLRAAPVAGARVSVWLGVSGVGDCAAGTAECVVTVTRDVEVGAVFEDVDECGTAADDCPSASSSCRNLDAVSGGGRFACDCAESLYEFDEAARSCGCATTGHLIFGEGGSRECKSPVICPSGYDDSNFDCVEDEATPLTPEQVASRDLCLAFGGVREAVPDLNHPGVCSNVDINDTFCFLESGEALSCRGLFEHVRDCNALNRPALDPWHCAAACGDKQARGRRCETVTR